MGIRRGSLVDPVAPSDDALTPYDQRHFLTYARLIDAANDATDWKIAATNILDCDVEGDVRAAKICYDSHVARAHWVVGTSLDRMLDDTHAHQGGNGRANGHVDNDDTTDNDNPVSPDKC